MTEQVTGEFTVSDLVRGWDDVRLLLATTDPDEAMTAELRPTDADVVATGHRPPVRDAGQMAGHVAAAARPR